MGDMNFKQWLLEDLRGIFTNEPSTPASADGNPPKINYDGSEPDDDDPLNPMKKRTHATAAYPELTAKTMKKGMKKKSKKS